MAQHGSSPPHSSPPVVPQQPRHPMVTRSRTDSLHPRQYTDGTIKWPPPQALLSTKTSIPKTMPYFPIIPSHLFQLLKHQTQ